MFFLLCQTSVPWPRCERLLPPSGLRQSQSCSWFLNARKPDPSEVFLGLASYYRRFFRNFVSFSRPQPKASEKLSAFLWIEEAQYAFDSMNASLTTTPFLTFPPLKKSFILNTDAKQFAIWALLRQEHGGCERVIRFASKPFGNSQTTRQSDANFWQLWFSRDISGTACSEAALQ